MVEYTSQLVSQTVYVDITKVSIIIQTTKYYLIYFIWKCHFIVVSLYELLILNQITMKKLKRVQIEEALLDNECNTISQMVINNDLSYVHDIFYSGFKGYAHFTDEELVAEYKEQLGEEVELIKPFAISISDGHEEDWQYFEDKESCLETFEKMKGFYDDIHVYEYIMEMEQYEVFLSFWIEDVENAADEDTSFEFEQYAQLTYVNDDENVRLFIDGRFVGRMYVWKDGEMEDREYLTINHEIVYLDTITQIFKLVTY